MKHVITETRLRNLISEAVRSMLNEVDLVNMPLFRDARDRDAWWRQQIINDYPDGERLVRRRNSDFMGLYYEIRDEKQRAEKEAKRQERLDKQKQRKSDLRRKEIEKKRTRQLFLKTVAYAIDGDDNILGIDKALELPDNEVFDGIEKMPIILKDGNRTRGRITNVGTNTYVFDNSGRFISEMWGVEVNGLEDCKGYVSIFFSVYVDERRNQLSFDIDRIVGTDSIDKDATAAATTNYLTTFVRKKMQEVADKMARYKVSLR